MATTLTALVEGIRAQRNAERAIAGETRARSELTRAVTLRLVSEAEAIVAGTRPGTDEQAITQLLAGYRLRLGAEVDRALAVVSGQRRRLLLVSSAAGPLEAAATSADAQRVVSIDESGVIRRWDGRTLQSLGDPINSRDKIRSVALSPDGARIVTAAADRTLRLWNTETGAAVGEPLREHRNPVSRVSFSPDGRLIVSATSEKLQLWDAFSGQPIASFAQSGSDETVSAIAISGDGRLMVSANSAGTLRLWSVASRRLVAVAAHGANVLSLAYSPDSRRIASGAVNQTLRVWDASNLRAIGRPGRGREGWLSSLAFSPDGKYIVSGNGNGSLRLWNATTAQPLGAPWIRHLGWVLAVRFTSDGRRVVSVGQDGTIRLWDGAPETPDDLTLRGHTDQVSGVTFRQWTRGFCRQRPHGPPVGSGLGSTRGRAFRRRGLHRRCGSQPRRGTNSFSGSAA